MGIEYQLVIDGKEFCFPLSRSDFELQTAVAKILPNECRTAFGSQLLGEESQISVSEYKNATEKIIEKLQCPDNSFGVYQYKFSDPKHHTMQKGYRSGKTSGIRLPNDPLNIYYLIGSGFDYCYLTQNRILVNGKAEFVQEIDIREKSEIETTNGGILKIRKSKSKSELLAMLLLVKKFVAEHEQGVVTIKLV